MAGVTISYGGVPIPKGWRLWTPISRPEPGRWFFEARYHHTNHWKLGLDFRPVDGAFPSFWQTPFLWKYALEIEHIQDTLGLPTKFWASQMLGIHPGNIGALEGALLKYAMKAKEKKKLLFGTAAGLGAHEHKVKSGLVASEVEYSDQNPGGAVSEVAGSKVSIQYDGAAYHMVVDGVAVHTHWVNDPVVKKSDKYMATQAFAWDGATFVAGDTLFPGADMLQAMSDKLTLVQSGDWQYLVGTAKPDDKATISYS